MEWRRPVRSRSSGVMRDALPETDARDALVEGSEECMRAVEDVGMARGGCPFELSLEGKQLFTRQPLGEGRRRGEAAGSWGSSTAKPGRRLGPMEGAGEG